MEENQDLPTNRIPLKTSLSDNEIEAIRECNLRNGEYSTGTISVVPDGDPIFNRILEAGSGETIDMGGDGSRYPEGTFFRDGNIYYPDGSVAQNAFSFDAYTNSI